MKVKMEGTGSSTYNIDLPFYDMKMDQIKKKGFVKLYNQEVHQ